jgi:hypothetical protein
MLSVEGIGWVMRECSDDVRLGIIKSAWSRVGGRSLVRGRKLKEGAIVVECCSTHAAVELMGPQRNRSNTSDEED